MCKECHRVITLRKTWHYSSEDSTDLAGPENSFGRVSEGNYIFSTAGSPAIQTEMTTELEQAAAFCCLL